MDTPENELTPEQEAMVAEAIESMKDVPMASGPYIPPSNTVVRTQFDGWYFVTESYEVTMGRITDVLETVPVTSRAFIEFDVVGNEATRVSIDFATITAIIDLTPRVSEETNEA